MAKTSVKQKRFVCRGLLVFVFFLIFGSLYAKSPSPAFIRTLKVKADNSSIFTVYENGFTLKIPGVEPANVQTDLPQLPEGVQLISSKKEEFIGETGTRGTAVHLWFAFKDTGPVRLPPLIVIIGFRTYYIPFDDITVFENPDLINPQALVEFVSGAKFNRNFGDSKKFTARAGEEIIFELNLKYFSQIISFNWKLPKNSIFEEIETSEYARGKSVGRNFSDKSLPVAKFRWKPLVEGEYDLPEFALTAIAYNGSQRTVKIPNVILTVLPASQKVENSEGKIIDKKLFNSAFSEPKNTAGGFTKKKIGIDDCKKIAELRSLERNSLFSGKVKLEREQLEKKFSLSNNENEIKKPFVELFAVCGIILLALMVIFIILKRKKIAIMLAFCMIFAFVASFYKGTQIFKNYGIFAGGNISPVPEETSSAVQNFYGGIRVKISEKTSDYFYIESSEINGWVKKELVFEIK